MKGVVLAGGLGTRLDPLTQYDNKHFLPIYKKRMIEYPILSLVNAGVKDIILITGGRYPGRFLELFKNGRDHGIDHLYYAYQEGEGGIAAALKLARNFVQTDESIMVILGDNYFDTNLNPHLQDYLVRGGAGAQILLSEVPDPGRFGVAEVDPITKNVISLEEKPTDPKSNLAITGCYFFDFRIWEILKTLQPSCRNELEVIDAIKHYWKLNNLIYSKYEGKWKDMGTFSTLLEVSCIEAKKDEP